MLQEMLVMSSGGGGKQCAYGTCAASTLAPTYKVTLGFEPTKLLMAIKKYASLGTMFWYYDKDTSQTNFIQGFNSSTNSVTLSGRLTINTDGFTIASSNGPNMDTIYYIATE